MKFFLKVSEVMADTVTFSDFQDLCRICGNKTSVLMGLHIFQREGDMRQIYKKITACLPIQVHNTDKLPKMVCEECVYKLDLLFDFREISIKTESVLSSLSVEFSKAAVKGEQIEITLPVRVAPSITTNPVSTVLGNDDAGVGEHLVQVDDIDVKEEPSILINTDDVASENVISSSTSSTDLNNGSTPHISSLPEIPDIVDESDCESGSETSGEDESMDHDSHFSQVLDSSGAIIENGQRSDEHATTDIKHNIKGDKLINDFLVQEQGDQTSWFFCNICGKAFVNKDEFNTHYEIHWNKCSFCGAIFTNEEALNSHRKEVHPGKNVGVKSEGKYSGNTEKKPQLEESQNIAKLKKRTEIRKIDGKTIEMKICPECGKEYRTNYKLAEHMRKHTGEKPYSCSMCEKAFRSKIGLAQHEAKHTGMFDYTCNSCGKGFQCKSYLIVHQRVHSDLKPYPCTTCGRNFKTKQSLLDHQNRHLGVKPYLCETCGRGFITKGLCKSHQKVHTGADNRQYPCTVCHKLFVSKSYLATHLRIHTGEKPYMCEVCGKGFLTRVDLRIHSTMHTGEKSFVCEVCGKAFARRDALRCHRRSHTGERPYRCDVCGQSFTQFSPMAIHKRLHTGERPYTCDVCEKTFVSRSTMMSHRKKHVP